MICVVHWWRQNDKRRVLVAIEHLYGMLRVEPATSGTTFLPSLRHAPFCGGRVKWHLRRLMSYRAVRALLIKHSSQTKNLLPIVTHAQALFPDALQALRARHCQTSNFEFRGGPCLKDHIRTGRGLDREWRPDCDRLVQVGPARISSHVRVAEARDKDFCATKLATTTKLHVIIAVFVIVEAIAL